MKSKVSSGSIFEKASETKADAAKCDFFPGNILTADECHFQAFLAGQIVGRNHFAPVKKVNLIDVGNTDHGIWGGDADLRASFLDRFANGSLSRRLAIFHKTGRKGPEAELGFDGSFAEQNLIIPGGEAANDQTWIFVLNMAATGTSAA